MVFPVVMYKCEIRTIKKAACQRIDAFELWCWRRLLRVLWTTRRSNQSILKEINPEYSLEEMMLKLKFQYFGTWWEELTHWKRPWCWERLKVGGEGDDRGWDGWMASQTQWTWIWTPGERNGNPLQYSCLGNPMNRSLVDYSPRGHEELDTTKVAGHSWTRHILPQRPVSWVDFKVVAVLYFLFKVHFMQ